MRVIIFGGSVVEGYYDTEKGGWISRLKAYFFGQRSGGKKVIIVNSGISGNTTTDINLRCGSVIDMYMQKKYENFIVILAFGANDTCQKNQVGTSKVPLKIFKKNIKDIITNLSCNSQCSAIIIQEIINVNEKNTQPVAWRDIYYSNERINQYNVVLKEIAQENNYGFISMKGVLQNEDLEDGVHPNAHGHEKIYLHVRDYLEKNIL